MTFVRTLSHKMYGRMRYRLSHRAADATDGAALVACMMDGHLQFFDSTLQVRDLTCRETRTDHSHTDRRVKCL